MQNCLIWRFDVAWKLADAHLTGLTTGECLWRPAKLVRTSARLLTGGGSRTRPSTRVMILVRRALPGSHHIWDSGGRWRSIIHSGSSSYHAIPSFGLAAPMPSGSVSRTPGARRSDNSPRPTSSRSSGRAGLCGIGHFATSWRATVEPAKNAAELGYARFLYAVCAGNGTLRDHEAPST
jgi:hypothetical protein